MEDEKRVAVLSIYGIIACATIVNKKVSINIEKINDNNDHSLENSAVTAINEYINYVPNITDTNVLKDEIGVIQDIIYSNDKKIMIENIKKHLKKYKDMSDLIKLRESLNGSANQSFNNGTNQTASQSLNNDISQSSSRLGPQLVKTSNQRRPPNIIDEAAFVNALLLAFLVEACGFVMLSAMLFKILD